jgi:hypothetical protein
MSNPYRTGPAVADLATMDMLEKASCRLVAIRLAIIGAPLEEEERSRLALLMDDIIDEVASVLTRLEGTREARDDGGS